MKKSEKELRAHRDDLTDSQVDKFFEKWAAADAAKEAAEQAEAERLAAMPITATCGDYEYRREGGKILTSWKGGEFSYCYDLREEEEFSESLIRYLSGVGEDEKVTFVESMEGAER